MYTVENLILLAYAHFLIFLVPAMGIGIAMLRDDYRARHMRDKEEDIHDIVAEHQWKKAA